MYKNAVMGTIQSSVPGVSNQQTIFHKYCYDSAIGNSKTISFSQLAPGTPQSPVMQRENPSYWKLEGEVDSAGIKRSLEVDLS